MERRTGTPIFTPVAATLLYGLVFPISAVLIAPMVLARLARAVVGEAIPATFATSLLALPHAALFGWGTGSLVPGSGRATELALAVVAIFATTIWFALRASSD